MIDIRILRAEEIPQALDFVWEVFQVCTAPGYSQDGVEEFRRFIQYDSVMPQWSRKEIVFWGAYEGMELKGVSALRTDGHIVLLDVAPVFQNSGIGRALYQAMVQFCQEMLHVFRMTVHAAPNAVPAYIKFGFRQIAPEQLENGIYYVPMEQMLPNPAQFANGTVRQGGQQTQQKTPIGLIIAVIAAAACIFFWQIFLLYSQFRYSIATTRTIMEEHQVMEEVQPDETEPETETEAGLAAVEPYIEEDLPYTITSDQYNDISINEQYQINFTINFPVIEAEGMENLDRVNERLKACAMETVDQMYTNPNQEMKEKLLGYSKCYLVSYTEYKATYMTEDLLSVAFEDYYVYGSTHTLIQLRTKTINMKTGEIYELKDIINLDEKFMEDWHERILEETDGNKFFEETSLEDLREILENGSDEIEFTQAYLVTANNVEPGMSYHYIDKEGNAETGWATAPFTVKELSKYKTNSDFWKHIDE